MSITRQRGYKTEDRKYMEGYRAEIMTFVMQLVRDHNVDLYTSEANERESV